MLYFIIFSLILNFFFIIEILESYYIIKTFYNLTNIKTIPY